MLEVIKQLIDLVMQFIDSAFSIKIDFFEGVRVSLLVVVLAFIFLIYSIYYILKAIGVLSDEGGE